MSGASMGELVLVVADAHIPARAAAIPEAFKKLLVPNKMQHVLSLGNLGGKGTLSQLNSLAPAFHADMSVPDTKVLTIGSWRIGMVNGYQLLPWGDAEAMAALARQLDVHVLLCGSTFKSNVHSYENRYILCPGSLSGAFHPSIPDVSPSFQLLAIKGERMLVYTYTVEDGELAIVQTELERPR